MIQAQSTLCCGIGQLLGINAPEFTVKKVLLAIGKGGRYTSRINTTGFGSCLISGAWDDSRTPAGFNNTGRRKADVVDRIGELAEYILEHELGEWYDIPDFRNPAHGSKVKSAMFIINKENFTKWYDDNHTYRGNHPTTATTEVWGNV